MTSSNILKRIGAEVVMRQLLDHDVVAGRRRDVQKSLQIVVEIQSVLPVADVGHLHGDPFFSKAIVVFS